MSAPYNPNTPQFPGDTFSTSQPQILANFSQLFNAFKKNHVSLDAGITAGNHTIVQLLENKSAVETDISEFSVYAKDVAGQTDQLFFRYAGNGQEVQLTNYQLYSILGDIYFTFLPGKLIVYFGTFRPSSSNNLGLFPAIARNIITVSLCPTSSATAFFKPNVKIPTTRTGIISNIVIESSDSRSVPECTYIVVANI